MVIWLDLDETLIASADSPRSGWITLGSERWAVLRPGARECLTALRGLGHVRLLTSARLAYAGEASVLFALGFAWEDIVAQELWTSFLRERPSLGRSGDVLIEDDKSRAIPAKCRFIGIGQDRVVLVPAFTGDPDDGLASVPRQVKLLSTVKGGDGTCGHGC